MATKKKKVRYVSRKKEQEKRKRKAGRPTVMTKATIGKLRLAFLMGASDREAAHYAEINPDTLYRYQGENPEFSEQKGAWKSHPILAARKVVVENIQRGDLATAKWYLSRKASDEFGVKAHVSTDKGAPATIAQLFAESD